MQITTTTQTPRLSPTLPAVAKLLSISGALSDEASAAEAAGNFRLALRLTILSHEAETAAEDLYDRWVEHVEFGAGAIDEAA